MDFKLFGKLITLIGCAILAWGAFHYIQAKDALQQAKSSEMNYISEKVRAHLDGRIYTDDQYVLAAATKAAEDKTQSGYIAVAGGFLALLGLALIASARPATVTTTPAPANREPIKREPS